ncbi:MAG: serine/threonine protein kinase [Planctomycetes bacterium]|nr:serine/threonine protein kinase [Planctomycetota bacterium]
MDFLAEKTHCVREEERAHLFEDLISEHLHASWRFPDCRDGRSLVPEDYLERFGTEFPQVLSKQTIPCDLIEREFRARHETAGADHPDLDDYARRFPGRDDILAHLKSLHFGGERYLRLEDIGQGGLGRVWKVYDTHLQREVAVKEPLPEVAGDPHVVALLEQEARITARLEHPAIVTLHSLRRDASQRPYYVMRLVEGERLDEVIAEYHHGDWKDAGEKRLLWNRLLKEFSTVCDAIAYAHSRHVVHRDLKPQNIILGEFGKTIVLDWGLAKRIDKTASDNAQPAADADAVSSESDPTDPMADTIFRKETPPAGGNTVVAGTPAYMSPEQMQGRVDYRTDIFGLGAVLYHILTGTAPYGRSAGRENQSVRINECFERIARADFPSPRRIAPQTPRALEAVCMKAMSRDPAQRYSSAAELREEINCYLADEPLHVRPDRPLAWIGRRLRRHKRAAIALTVLAVVAITGISIQWQRAEAGETEARENNKNTEKQRDRAERFLALASGLGDYLIQTGAEKLVDTPGTAAVRKELVEKSLHYYQTIIDERGDQAGDAKAKLALAHFHMGVIHSELGENNAARISYQTALSQQELLLVKNPRDADLQEKLVKTVNNLALLEQRSIHLDRAVKLLFRAGELWNDLRQRFPENASFVWKAAGNYTNIGVAHRLRQDYPAAKRAYVTAVKLLSGYVKKYPTDHAARGALAGARMNLANLLSDEGDIPESLRLYRLAVADFTTSARAQPGSRDIWSALADAISNYAVLLRQMGAIEKAVQEYEKAIDIRSKLHRFNPQIPAYTDSLASTHLNLGIALQASGKSPLALEHFKKAASLRRELNKTFPDTPRFQSNLSNALIKLAESLATVGKHENALKLFSEAEGTLLNLRKRFPQSVEYHRRLARLHQVVGVAYSRNMKFDEAVAAYNKAIILYKELVSRYPNSIGFRSGLSAAYGNCGIAMRHLGKPQESLKLTEMATASLEELSRRSPEDRGIRVDLLTSYEKLIRIYRALKSVEKTVVVARKMLAFAPQHLAQMTPVGLYNVASELAACLPLIGKDKTALTADERVLKTELTAASLTILRQAIKNGFKSSLILKQDENFKSLRAHPQFKQLLQQLTKPAKTP